MKSIGYKIIVSPRAQNEMVNAIDYYALYSSGAPLNFINALKEAYTTLEKNQSFKVRYKNVKAIKLQRFPYSLYFVVDEKNRIVRILSCFHNKRNPKNRPRI